MSNYASYKQVPILRPGSYTDAAGAAVSFSADDLSALAASYDPALHLATLNLDHEAAGPALGRVSSLSYDPLGRQLLADIDGVPEHIAAAVEAGAWPGRSVEVYSDLNGRGFYLRGLALLGARPPAVKGLPPMPAREPPAKEPAARTPGIAAHAPGAVHAAARVPQTLTMNGGKQ